MENNDKRILLVFLVTSLWISLLAVSFVGNIKVQYALDSLKTKPETILVNAEKTLLLIGFISSLLAFGLVLPAGPILAFYLLKFHLVEWDPDDPDNPDNWL